MKKVLKKIIFKSLLKLVRYKMHKSGAQVVGVTGSKGKSSAKEAIASVLSEKYSIVESPKNLNSEFGLCLSVLGYKKAPSSLFSYLPILILSYLTALLPVASHDFYVLEMGIDKPGDMDKILELFTPDIMLFLNVFEEHMAEGQFESKLSILKEKGKACKAVNKDGLVILNLDDPLHSELAPEINSEIQWVSLAPNKNKKCSWVSGLKSDMSGLSLKLHLSNGEHELRLPEIYGDINAYMALSAVMIGEKLGLSWNEIEAGLKKWRLPAGRMTKLNGVRNSIILDSSYNGNPASISEALKVLASFKGRKIAAIGSMNELGKASESKHKEIGKLAALSADELIFVGHSAKHLAEGARQAKVHPKHIKTFENSLIAAENIPKTLNSGDVILIKGSQSGVRMEHLSKACLADPKEAKKKLVRQGMYWLNHPLA